MAVPPHKPTVFITISPPTNLMSLRYRLQHFHDELDPILRRMSTSYILYPEFDSHGRLHFHGFLHGFDNIKYIATNYKLNRIGWTKIDTIKSFKDHIRMVMYCQKEWRKTVSIFKLIGIEIEPLFKKHLRRSQLSINRGLEPPRTTIYDFFNGII